MKSNEKGFGNIIYGAVGLVIFLILITSVIMPVVMNANKAGTDNKVCYNVGPPVSYNNSCPWDAGSVALWGVLGLVVVASAIMFVVGKK